MKSQILACIFLLTQSVWVHAFELPQGMQVLKNRPYGEHKRQVVDVYMPDQAKDAPIVFMVHGGAWRTGDKTALDVIRNKGLRWVKKGFVFTSTNYRLVPEVTPLVQAQDVASALAFIQRHAKSKGGDPAKVILIGHSAGAHLVALLAANPELAYQQGAQPWLGSIVLDTAAMNVVGVMQANHFKFYDGVFGANRQFWESVSPHHQLTSAIKPILVVCSSSRADKPCIQAQAFRDKATSLGGKVVVQAEALDHGEINELLELPGKYTEAVENFMGELDPTVKQHLQ